MAKKLHSKFVVPNRETSAFARFLDGKELIAMSLSLGLLFGAFTNAPDQMKTNIQTGQFKNMREAWAWQVDNGGVRGLFGKAAVYRALYIAHAVIAFNFARDKVESFLNAEEIKRKQSE